jgi:hypothetical protein
MWTESGGGVAESTAYLHGDSLGSLETVTGEGGQVLERRKYQPYGQRGEPSNPARAVAAGGGAYRQGFTGHEGTLTAVAAVSILFRAAAASP